MSVEGTPPVAIARQRELTIGMLCEHFALDHLAADELEKRIDQAHSARTTEELRSLLSGLPALRDEPALLEMSDLEMSQTVVAIMGGAERRGGWIPARTIRVLALMGGAVLDFRDVRLPRGTINVEVYALMGGVEILVPPSVRVSCEGVGIMGAFEQQADRSPAGELSETGLRVTGIAMMGGVEVKERRPGESAAEARRRRKRERQGRID